MVPKKVLIRLYTRIFGCTDIHSHIRFSAVMRHLNGRAKAYADVGAGPGWLAFEVAKHTNGKVTGIVYEESDLNAAEESRLENGFGNVNFEKGSILDLSHFKQKFDEVLCIDVLEHIGDDERAIKNLRHITKPGGRLILSVPTPSYPNYFGNQFSELIGHVRAGYSLGEITSLLEKNGFGIIEHEYHTKVFGKLIAKIFYKNEAVRKNSAARLLLLPFFLPLAYLDKYTHTATPAGIIVVAKRKR